MQIIPLSEGSFSIDKSKMFVPFETDADDLQQRPRGSLLVEVQPFVVITKTDVILIDTGLGFTKNGAMQLHTNLKQNNIEPAQVTNVLLSHLHKDHAGGVCSQDRLGHYHPAMPGAAYYIQKKEYEYAMDTGLPSYMTDEIGALGNTSNIIWLDGDGELDGGIRYSLSGGHSPYHQVFWIEEEGETIFFGGDEAPQLSHLKRKFVAKYDYDGKRASELRQQWWQQGRSGQWTFLFYHDTKKPFCKAKPH